MFTLDEIKNKAVPIAKKYNIISLSLFGSYARNEQNDKSDLDFLIVANDKMGLFEYVEFYQELENAFGCHIDVVSSGIDDRDFLKMIEKDKKVLCAA
ncbi:MAG: nucleotidyltransferase domain-containing protein [Lachnospiraceae bacterium]|nr:nucleotidyltransferase domain-containing protein [Lachnospiraceae bacterium]